MLNDASELVRNVNLVVVLGLAAFSVQQWRRHRDQAARWFALAFVALVTLLVSRRVVPGQAEELALVWVQKLSVALGVTFPYFLYRFATSLRPPPHWLQRGVQSFTAALMAWTLVLPRIPLREDPRPGWFSVYILAALTYWTGLSVLVVVRLWRAGVGQPGVARHRMRTLSLASGLMNLGVLIGGRPPSPRPAVLELVLRLCLLVSAGLFVVGFRPPSLLRAIWRRSEEEAVRRSLELLVTARTRDDVCAHLLPAVGDMLGGQAVALVGGDSCVLSQWVRPGGPGMADGEAPLAGGELSVQDLGPAGLELGPGLGSLRVWASPYTPFFGEEELKLVRSLAAVAELAVERIRVSEREAQLAAIVQSSGEAIIGAATDGTITSWNSGAEKLYGYRAEEVVGRSLAVLFPPHRRDQLALVLHSLERGQHLESYEAVGADQDGTPFDISLSVSPIIDAVGAVSGGSLIVHDVSQLTAAKREAEATSRAKSEFLANMSHEIRTPMTGVIGMIDLLLRTDLSPEQRDYAATVRNSADALLAVINDILDFSKVEAGRISLESVPFDLRTAVEEVAELLAGPAHDKGLELAVHFEPAVPRGVSGDPGRLRQVLVNLVSNAVKFTSEGEVVVRVGVAQDSGADVMLRFEVSDTGIGIAAEDQARLFTSFSQVDASSTRRYGGTGLGLAISKRLVELMGGDIGVQSEAGRGSTFWFTVQFQKVPGFGATTPSSELQGLPVLIVDDSPTNRAILEQDLSAWTMAPASAESGAQALRMLRSAAATGRPYALVLLDHQMPEMDGVELARAITSDAAIPPTPMVLLSSSGTSAATLPEGAGVEAILAKPARHSALYDAVVRALGLTPPSVPAEPITTGAGPLRSRAAGEAHVLVVEDNPVNQTVAAEALAFLGYHVDVAANGVQAVEAVSRRPYAAVFMDCHMPEMDGYEATRQIRRLRGGNRIPIIALTAGAMKSDEERARAAGMDDYMAKPVKVEDLEAALARWARSGGGGLAEAAAPHQADVTAAVTEPGGLDPSILARLDEIEARSGKKVVSGLVRVFAEQAEADLGTLRSAVQQGDSEAVAMVAHRLRGSCAGLGATGMAGLCGQLETLAEQDLAAAAGVVARLEQEFQQVKADLVDEISS